MSITFDESEIEKLEQLRDRMVLWATARGPVSPGLIYESYQEFEILLREAKERAMNPKQEEVES